MVAGDALLVKQGALLCHNLKKSIAVSTALDAHQYSNILALQLAFLVAKHGQCCVVEHQDASMRGQADKQKHSCRLLCSAAGHSHQLRHR